MVYRCLQLHSRTIFPRKVHCAQSELAAGGTVFNTHLKYVFCQNQRELADCHCILRSLCICRDTSALPGLAVDAMKSHSEMRSALAVLRGEIAEVLLRWLVRLR